MGAGDERSAGAMHLQERLLEDVLAPRLVRHTPAQVARQPRGERVVDRVERRRVSSCIPAHRLVDVVHMAPFRGENRYEGQVDVPAWERAWVAAWKIAAKRVRRSSTGERA